MGKFSDHLRGQINRVLTETNFKINYVAYTLFTKIVNNSPHVGDGPYVAGHFVANWMPAINSYDSSTTNNKSDGSDSLNRIDVLIKNSNTFYRKDGFVTLSNNLSYGPRIELLGWPAGIDPESGWKWTGLRRVYAPIQTSFTAMKGQI